jgi:hypothetical protein
MFSCLAVLLLAAGALPSACGPRNEAREIADAFCYRYFIELNQPGALEISGGLAAEKLRKEIELLKGAARAFEGGEQEFHRAKPFIDYKMTQRTDQDAERVMFIYHVSIEARQGSEKMAREIVLSTVRENGRWLVNNFDIETR